MYPRSSTLSPIELNNDLLSKVNDVIEQDLCSFLKY